MDGTKSFEEMVSRILSDLELDSLRAQYRITERHLRSNALAQLSYFYSSPYEFVSSPEERQAQKMEAKALKRVPGVTARRLELAADGIWAEIVSSTEPGNSHLITFVKFSERGRR